MGNARISCSHVFDWVVDTQFDTPARDLVRGGRVVDPSAPGQSPEPHDPSAYRSMAVWEGIAELLLSSERHTSTLPLTNWPFGCVRASLAGMLEGDWALTRSS